MIFGVVYGVKYVCSLDYNKFHPRIVSNLIFGPKKKTIYRSFNRNIYLFKC